MTSTEAVNFIVDRFPFLRHRVDNALELFETPHVTYGLLATEALENQGDETFLSKISLFVDELAGSGDDLLEELLVVDILEGMAQDPDLARRLGAKIGPKAKSFLGAVETGYFGRDRP